MLHSPPCQVVMLLFLVYILILVALILLLLLANRPGLLLQADLDPTDTLWTQCFLGGLKGWRLQSATEAVCHLTLTCFEAIAFLLHP